MNEEFIKGKWNEIKGEVQKKWGTLTNDELEATKGDLKIIGGLIQQKFGESQEIFKGKMDTILQDIKNRKDAIITDAKEKLN